MQFDYRPQTTLREGNVFTGVFLSTGGKEGCEDGGEHVFSDDHQVSLVGGEYVRGRGLVSQVYPPPKH